jgi:hypothetical protein
MCLREMCLRAGLKTGPYVRRYSAVNAPMSA